MIPLLEQHREQIAGLCRKYGVRKLELFGSAARDDFDPTQSDVDLFYEFNSDPTALADRYFGLSEELEQLLGRQVDLVSSQDVRNPYFLQVANQYRVTLYAAETAKYLRDILDAAGRIATYTGDKTQDDYLGDSKLRDAVQWNFAVIGEALSQLEKTDPDTAHLVTEWRRIIAFRNQLIHGYGVIRHQITWDIIQNKLPILHSNVQALLDNP